MLKFLIVSPERNKQIEEIIRKHFAAAGLLWASGKEQGLALAHQERPEVILLDHSPPGVNAVQLCQELKADAPLAQIPVILIFDPRKDPQIKEAALETAAEGILESPFGTEELVSLLKLLLRLKTAESAFQRAGPREIDLQESALRQFTRDSYFQLLDCLQEGIWVLDREGKTSYVNPNLAKMLGYSADEMLGKKIYEFVEPDRVKEAKRLFLPRKKHPQKIFEFEFLHKKGRPIYVLVSLSPVVNKSGKWTGTIASLLDFSKRKMYESKLEESERKFRNLFEHIADYALIVDPEGKEGPVIVDASQSACRMLGYPYEELVGKLVNDLDDEENRRKIPRRAREILEKGKITFETVQLRKDGTPLPVEVTARLIDIGGKRYIYAIQRDITHRKEAERAIRESEEKYRNLIKYSPVGMLVIKEERVVMANRALAETLGFDSEEEILARSILDFVHPDFQKIARKRLRQLAKRKTNRVETVEEKLIRKDGRIIDVLVLGQAVEFEGGPAVQGYIYDITEQKRFRETIQKQKQFLTNIIESLTHPFFVININDYSIEIANQAAHFQKREGVTTCYALLYGRSEPCNGTLNYCPVEIMKKTKKPVTVEHVRLDENNREKFVEIHAYPIFDENGVLVQAIEYSFDITLRKQAERKLSENEERFRAIVEYSHAGIILVDNHYRFLYVNKRFAEITGYEQEELVGKDFRIILDEESKALVSDRYRRRQQGEEVPSIYEFNVLRKDGSIRRVEIRSTIITDSRGQVQTIAQILDITERKKLEQELLYERDLLHALMDNIPDKIYFKDNQFRFTRVNQAMAQVLGLKSPEEAVGRSEAEFFDEETAREILRDEQAILDTGIPLIDKIEKIKYPDQSQHWISVTKVPIRDAAGKIVGLVGISRDITDRIQAEEALKESEERYRNLIEQSNDAIYLLFNNRFEIINRRFTEMFGITLEEANSPDFNFLQLVAPKSIPFLQERIRRQQRGEKLEPIYEFTAIDKSGNEIDCEVSVSYIKYKGGVATQGILRDITERKRAERQLSRLAAVIEQSSETVVITDVDGNIEYVNPAFEKTTGYTLEEVLGQNPRVLKSGHQDEQFYRELWETITSGNIWKGSFINRKKDGTLYYEDATIFPIKDRNGNIINFAAVKRDVTPERMLEEQVRQAQKMEAIGKLAGGVAHDFNNLLTVINGYCELLQTKIKPNQPFYREIELIRRAGERASALTSQLLAFSRRQVIQPEVLNLNRVVAATEKMLRRLIGEDVELITVLEPNLKSVKIDPVQVDQVIMNLAVNARDAMPQGGKLTIETANVHLDEEYTRAHLGARPGDYVMLAISDTGVGMDHEIQKHIFEPFFTTKGKGKGTGLGLSTVYGIVKQNNGFIWVYSEPGKGTTFKIYFPQVEEDSQTSDSQLDEISDLRGDETILLVEDDDGVRELAQITLRESGYQVMVARNGNEALRLLDGHPEPIHLLLTDVIMPEMSGRQLAEKVLRKRPDIKVLYMSGYTYNAIVHHGVLEEGTEFIQKPFNAQNLLRKVREVLQKSSYRR